MALRFFWHNYHYVPISLCSDNSTGLPWDPYATLPTQPGAGAAGITTSTYPRPAKNKKAAAIQIMVMTMLVCAAVIGMAGKWWTDQSVYSWQNIQTHPGRGWGIDTCTFRSVGQSSQSVASTRQRQFYITKWSTVLRSVAKPFTCGSCKL